MIIHHSSQVIQPIIKTPRHDPDDFKTPSLKKVESEFNLSNPQTKEMAQEVVAKVYQDLQKLVKNTEYNISVQLDDFSSTKQFRFTDKKSGELIVAMPPDLAIQVAERAKQQSIGLLLDFSA